MIKQIRYITGPLDVKNPPSTITHFVVEGTHPVRVSSQSGTLLGELKHDHRAGHQSWIGVKYLSNDTVSSPFDIYSHALAWIGGIDPQRVIVNLNEKSSRHTRKRSSEEE